MDDNYKGLKIELPCEYSSGDEVFTSSSENDYYDNSELLEQVVVDAELVIDFQKEQEPDEVLVKETPLPQSVEKQKQYSILNTIFRIICNPFKKIKFVK
jgi:hypothetical protein